MDQPNLFITQEFDHAGGFRFRMFSLAFDLWLKFGKRIKPRDCFKLVVSL